MKKLTLIVLFLMLCGGKLKSQVVFIQNADQLKIAVNSASPGDTIIVKAGQFDTDGSVTIRNKGAADSPIVIKSEFLNGTEFINESYFDFRQCEYMVLDGFIFSSLNVTAVKLQGSNHIRITNNIFRIKETESVKWVYVGGVWNDAYAFSHDNKIDHNIFENKTLPGNYITIDGSSEPTYQVSQRDTIEFNYFRFNQPRADNEKESIRIGWSELSASSGYTVVQYNLFEECDGDPEIVSVKTCDNTIRYNTFLKSKGTLCLRHGNRTSVYGNFFIGMGVAGTGGIRIYGDDHKIYNNYFEGLTGTKWDAPITLTNGDYDGGTNYSKHWRIKKAKILFNTLVNNTNGIEIGFTNNGSYSKPPQDVEIANNIIVGNENDLVQQFSSPVNMIWINNILYPEGAAHIGIELSESEIKNENPALQRIDSLWKLSSNSCAIDSAIGNWDFINEDIDGQQREQPFDIGADEFSQGIIVNKILTTDDVGPQTDSITSVSDYENLGDVSVKLNGNYPNPFNNSTKIDYTLFRDAKVKIIIYNILGKQITKLIDKELIKGKYSIIWDAGELSSGIYLLKIETEQSVITHKMLYLK